MYTFKGWEIETKSNASLTVVSDQKEENFIVFDEERDPLLWIRPSEYGNGIVFDKMGWGATVDVLHDEKKIIITFADPIIDDDEEE